MKTMYQSKSWSPTFSHEGAFAVVHDLLWDEGVVHHLVVSHAAEAAVFHTAVHLLLREDALEEGAHLLYGAR